MKGKIPNLLDHPPYSSDMNAIELIWKIVKDQVEKQSPKNLEEIKIAIEIAWNSLKLETIN